MPVHDWTRVEAGIFHDFHTMWTVLLRNSLNRGVLPPGYYAMAEQHAGRAIADVLEEVRPPAGRDEEIAAVGQAHDEFDERIRSRNPADLAIDATFNPGKAMQISDL